MTLFDCSVHGSGRITAVGGDGTTHRRLVDMGLLGSTFTVRARTKRSVLAAFGIGFAAVIPVETAAEIEIIETVGETPLNEDRALRKSKRRKNDAV